MVTVNMTVEVRNTISCGIPLPAPAASPASSATSATTAPRYHSRILFESTSHTPSPKVNRRRYQGQRRHGISQGIDICRGFRRRNVHVVGLGRLRGSLCPHSSGGRGGHSCSRGMMSCSKFGLGQNVIVAFAVLVDWGGWPVMFFVRSLGFLARGVLLS